MQPQPSQADSAEQVRPQSNISKISIGGDVGGLIVSAGLVVILLIGVPPIRWFLVVSLLLGVVVALVLRLTARDR